MIGPSKVDPFDKELTKLFVSTSLFFESRGMHQP